MSYCREYLKQCLTYRKCCVSTRYYYRVTKKKKKKEKYEGHGTEEWERQFLEALVYFQFIHSKLLPHCDRAERVVSEHAGKDETDCFPNLKSS